MSSTLDVATSMLRNWASFSRGHRNGWRQSRSLNAAAELYATERSLDVARLLAKSQMMLGHLPDPLRADLVLHAWLSAMCEESYSDWFAWVLQELAASSLLLDLLGLTDPKLALELQGCEIKISREESIRVNLHNFRLDIVIRFFRNDHVQRSLIIEVKKGSAESSYTEKQSSYCCWHQMQVGYTTDHACAFLIVTEAQRMEYFGFQVVGWAELCVQLRRMLPTIEQKRGIVQAAMVVAFISAVEPNLLGLRLPSGSWDSFAGASVAEHLQRATR